ncbi:MAG: phosphoribosyltransferase family protein [Parafilimonas sp.]
MKLNCEDKVLGLRSSVKTLSYFYKMENRIILTSEASAEKLHRMALEVAEQLSEDNTELFIIGIEGAGKFGIEGTGKLIAAKVADYLKNYISSPIKIMSLHLNKHKPAVITLSEEINFDDKNILLVDDVSNTGKTLVYALKPFMQFHPKRIQTLVMVERMHKLFPIKPDYVGYSFATAADDYVKVEEKDGNISALIVSSN